MVEFVTKDSGQRVDFASGMRRDVADEKPNFALCLAEGVPFEDQLLTRWAALMQRGAKKYGDRNWELASSKEELERFRSSALRHMMQWATGDAPEEDHAAAVLFNLAAYEATKLKLDKQAEPDLTFRAGARVKLAEAGWTHSGHIGTITDTGGSCDWLVTYDDGATISHYEHELEVIG